MCGPVLMNLSHPWSRACLRATHYTEEEQKARFKVAANMHIFNHGLLYFLLTVSYHESLILHSCISHFLPQIQHTL